MGTDHDVAESRSHRLEGVMRMSAWKKIGGVALFAGLLAVSAVVPAAAHHGHKGNRSIRFVTLSATLNGANEVPGPGDADGSGVAEVDVAARNGVLCFSIAVEGIGLPATAAHVHAGAAGIAGDIVVPLEAPVAFGSGAAGASSGCLTKVSSSLLKDIATNPSQYYVNVHNAEFPSGAVRGQLAAA
jgi:hypothetical protein